MRRLLPVLAGALSVGLLACEGEEAVVEDAGRPVTLARVGAVDLVDRIEATGQLIPEQRAEIAAEVSGRVTEIILDEGSRAGPEAVVLTIDPERRQLELDRARAQGDEARAALGEQRREHARVKELHERKVASATQLDAAATALDLARSRLQAAEAELGVARRALEDARVRAPFGGVVAERYVSRGEFVAQGQKLFELVALDPIQVEFHVNEVDSGRVRVGQQVDVRVAPYPDQTFRATVTVVSPTIDERTRTLRVKGRIPNADERLRPGLFARVDLGVAERHGVAMVPEEAVLQRAAGPVVFRTDGERRAEQVAVETGVHQAGAVEIVRGLRPGDLVVVRGHAALADGERVQPRTPEGESVDGHPPHVATQ